MPQTEFERINISRAYPFVAHNDDQLYGIVADLQLTIRPSGKYSHGKHRVYLQSLGPLNATQTSLLGMAAGSRFIALSSDAPGLQGSVLVFAIGVVRRYAEILSVEIPMYRFADAVLGDAYGGCISPSRNTANWEGHIVVGDLDGMPSSLRVLDPLIAVEPARIINSPEAAANNGRTFVYNQIATQYSHPAGCEGDTSITLSQSGDYVRACCPITGEFRLAGGYQTRLSQDTTRRQLTVSADRMAGEQGRSCESLSPVAGVDDTDTSPRCDEVLRSINGIGGPSIKITAMESVEIGLYPNQHRIIIAPTGSDAATCPEPQVAEPVDYLPVSDLNVPCGNFGQPLPPPPGPPDDRVGYLTAVSVTTTTTATPVSTMCRWVSGTYLEWLLDNYPCGSPQSCSLPTTIATSIGQIATTACLTQVDEYDTLILNPYFSYDIPLGSWNVSGNVTVVSEDTSIPPLPIGVLPVARLVGGTTGASLDQRSIPLPLAGSYLLQFGCRVIQGVAELAIGTEFGFQSATRISLTTADYTGWHDVEVGPLLFTSGPLRLAIVASPGAIIEISQFALVRH